MSSNRQVVKSYLTPEEFNAVQASAARAGLSLSTFLKKVSRGQQVKSIEHQQERRELRRMRGDLGRIGGLLKQALATGVDKERIFPLLRELDSLQQEMNTLIAILKND